LTPRKPKPTDHSLPPILCRKSQEPRSGYSKASWGLSVLPRVTSIFTGTAISPGPPSRQCPSRYSIRAGRNLPDKEFRSVYSCTFIQDWTLSSSTPINSASRGRLAVFIEAASFAISFKPGSVKCRPSLIMRRTSENFRASIRFFVLSGCSSKKRETSRSCSSFRTRNSHRSS
jgi:hypothetical protein